MRVDPATGATVITFNDLADYLELHGLKIVRSEWKEDQPRPTYYVAAKDGSRKEKR